MISNKLCMVFGSNTAGIHGAGAARDAYENKGAYWGKGYGHFGDSFAIPTKGHVEVSYQKYRVGDTLEQHLIEGFVAGFLAYAECNPNIKFQITRIGCGLAGLKDEWVYPMFLTAPINCLFDTKWKHLLEKHPRHIGPYEYWGTV